jgi:predicted negative regulator of RcsB-dependent stress response
LGDCYLDLGLAAQARAAYEEGLRRTPNAEPLVTRLAALDKGAETRP